MISSQTCWPLDQWGSLYVYKKYNHTNFIYEVYTPCIYKQWAYLSKMNPLLPLKNSRKKKKNPTLTLFEGYICSLPMENLLSLCHYLGIIYNLSDISPFWYYRPKRNEAFVRITNYKSFLRQVHGFSNKQHNKKINNNNNNNNNLTPWLMESGSSMLSNNTYLEPNQPSSSYWYLFF